MRTILNKTVKPQHMRMIIINTLFAAVRSVAVLSKTATTRPKPLLSLGYWQRFIDAEAGIPTPSAQTEHIYPPPVPSQNEGVPRGDASRSAICRGFPNFEPI
jgi:hypothetical protein